MFTLLETPTSNPITSLLPIGMILVMFVAMYFLMIRPQKKQEQEQNNMRNNLQVGDEITTIGGIIGKIVSIKEETLVLETSRDGTKIRILKTCVAKNNTVHETPAAAAPEPKAKKKKDGKPTEIK